MKFCMQPPVGPSFELANFQLGRKGQRPKGPKAKRPNFQKLSEAILIKSKVVHNVFMCIFKLKRPISRNFALELRVKPDIFENVQGLPLLQQTKKRVLQLELGSK